MTAKVTAKELLAQAEAIVAAAQQSSADVDAILDIISDYLDSFDVWQDDFAKLDLQAMSAEDKAELTADVKRLNDIHQAIVELAGAIRDGVGTQMSDLFKKSNAVKAYLNKYPSRVTIAGKRRG